MDRATRSAPRPGRSTVEDEELDLFVDPLPPFTLAESALAPLRWGLAATYLGGWLGAFLLLDRTVLPGNRFDRIGKYVCRRTTSLLGIRLRRHGLEHLAPGASYVFCINHVSVLDLFVVFQSIPYFHRSFQDASHFRVPIYGGLIRVFGQIPVDRTDRELNRRAYERAVEMIHAGSSFVVFPEGHRTRDGRLGPFYPGAFRLAVQAQVPVVPMGLRGLRGVCPAGDWRVRPGTVDVLFGEPIPTAGLGADSIPSIARRTRASLNEVLRSSGAWSSGG
jgi:1-acyl-sn-glycerol-3-phosphate acyltransferase